MDKKLPHHPTEFDRVLEQLHGVARHVREGPSSRSTSPPASSSPKLSAVQEEIHQLERSIADLEVREKSLRDNPPEGTLKIMSTNLDHLEDALTHNQHNIQGLLESLSPKAPSHGSPSQALSHIESSITHAHDSLEIQESFAKEQIGVMDQLDAVCTSVHQSVSQSAASLHQHRLYLQSEQLRQFNERQRLSEWETQLRSREEEMLYCIDHAPDGYSGNHAGKLQLFESFYSWAKH